MLCSIVDDRCLPQPQIVNSLQSQVTVASDVPTQNEKTLQQVTDCHAEDDAGQKNDSGLNVFIRHDQVPLKAHCPRCSFTCNSDSQLALHMKTGHDTPPYWAYRLGNFKCTECNMNTPKKDVLFWHLSHHTGSHLITYYGCSGCHVEKQYTRNIVNHITKKHGKRGGNSKCTYVTRVTTVHYLDNIMKCPVCKDGLLWKHIFVEHLRDKHNLFDLASYIETNYDDKCPDIISFPSHLVTEVTESSQTLTISRFHCENCEFSTNDSDAYWRHQTSHSETRIESDSGEADSIQQQKSSDANNVDTDHTLYHRAAKVKAFSQIVKPKSPKQKNQSIKRKVMLHRKSRVLKQTSSKPQEYSKLSKTANAAGDIAASKNVAAPPQSTADTNFFTFIEKLPSSFVFPDEIKCPACSFASRVRLNLKRHVLKHIRSTAAVSNETVTSEAKTGESSVCLSYHLWKPNSSGSSVGSAEEQPPGLRKPEARNASLTSLNSKDNDNHQTTEEISSSQTENIDGFPEVPDACHSSAFEAEDESTVEPDSLCCKICSKEFSLDVDLAQHISEFHGGSYVCHLCGVLTRQKNAMSDHYDAMHPGSPLLFEVCHRNIDGGSKEVGGSGTSERKIAIVQGIHILLSLLFSYSTKMQLIFLAYRY